MPLEFQPMPAPRVEPVTGPLGRVALMRQMARNVLAIYGPDAYRTLNLHGSFLNRRSLLTSDPEVIHQVLVERPDDFRRTAATMRILEPVLGDGLFLAQGQNWKFQRRTMAPAFAPRAMHIVAEVSRHVAAGVLDRFGHETGDVDLLEVMQEIALEVAGQSMFSLSMRERGRRVRPLFEGYGLDVGRPYPLDLLLPSGIPSPTDWRRRRLGRRWLACIDALLNERAGMAVATDPAGQARDLYDLLVQARDPETGRGFERGELRDQFATMIIAGHETTALALLWTMLMVARQPGLQAALRREACRHQGHRVADLERLVLHRSVIQEVLRLFPPAFLIVREAARPMRLAGRILFKGDLISISPWLLHRHEQHWEAPGAFDATRFMADRAPPRRLTYLPFGAGPRICIGMAFALTEACAVLAAISRRFTIELQSEQEITPVAVVTTYPQPLPRFRLTRHSDQRLAA